MKRKLETTDNKEDQKVAKIVNFKLENTNSDPKDVEHKLESQSSFSIENKGSIGLPNDFFDDPNQSKEAANETTEINEQNEEMDTSNTLPKGFFDDPIMDAKARKVVYKNPIDEQWDEFQKVIAEENNRSQNIIEEDVEELQIERNIEEIEEQIANWIKVNEMQKRAEILHNFVVTSNPKKEDSDSDVDEQDLNPFSDWRSRTALNSKR